MTFQIRWRVAWQLRQPVSSGPWDASYHAPKTCTCSVSLGGLETSLKKGGTLFPNPYLEVQRLDTEVDTEGDGE